MEPCGQVANLKRHIGVHDAMSQTPGRRKMSGPELFSKSRSVTNGVGKLHVNSELTHLGILCVSKVTPPRVGRIADRCRTQLASSRCSRGVALFFATPLCQRKAINQTASIDCNQSIFSRRPRTGEAATRCNLASVSSEHSRKRWLALLLRCA